MAHHVLDPIIDELEPPTAEVGGVVYTGRFLSIQEWYAKRRLLESLSTNSLNPLELRVAVRHLVDAMFPYTGPPWWKFWTWLKPRPRRLSALILELPLRTQMRIITGFIDSQTKAMDLSPTTASE